VLFGGAFFDTAFAFFAGAVFTVFFDWALSADTFLGFVAAFFWTFVLAMLNTRIVR